MSEPRFAKGDTVLQRNLYKKGRRFEGKVTSDATLRADHPKPGFWYWVQWSSQRMGPGSWAHQDVLLVIREAITVGGRADLG